MTALALFAACSGLQTSDTVKPSTSGDGGETGASDGQGPDDGAVGPASGVVLVHAAAFPAFRLCFENYPDLVPQPDSAVMPEANVVGVEVGSVVRLPPLETPPGAVYVVDQREVRTSSRDPLDRKCGALLADTKYVSINRHYQLAGRVDRPLGVGHADVLAITGCGGAAWMNELAIPTTGCTAYDPKSGSLQALAIPLATTVPTTADRLPIEVVHLAPRLDDAARGAGEVLDLSFGALDRGGSGRLGQAVAVAPRFGELEAPTVLAVPPNDAAVFGSHGFRIALRRPGIRSGDAGSPATDPDGGDEVASFVIDQSLADVQSLSLPQTVPTSYFGSPSNYVVFVVGDPRITRALPDGGANAAFDPRLGVHLLAVPVKDDRDAGALRGAIGDAGDGDADDSGAGAR